MNPLDKLGEEMDELLEGFTSTAIHGDLNRGVTQYTFWMLVASIVLLVLVFVFKKKLREELKKKR